MDTMEDIGPGTMKVTATFTDGHVKTYPYILVPTSGEAIKYKDGRVEFETAHRDDPLLYTLLNVRSLYTESE